METPTSDTNHEVGAVGLTQQTDSTTLTVRVTILSNPRKPLSKTKALVEGRPTTTAVGAMPSHAEIRTVDGIDGLADLLSQLTPAQALAYGLPARNNARVTTQELLPTKGEGWIARDRDHLTFQAGPGVLMLDYDPPKGQTPKTREELLAALCAACPDLAGVACVWRPSASSCLYHADTGEELTGIAGQRVYYIEHDATDIPRAGAVLFDRLWLTGNGYYAVSVSGRLLPRAVIDASVFQPERLDYAGGAVCVSPVIQQRPPARVIPAQQSVLDTRTALPDLTASEKQQLHAIQQKAKAAMHAQASQVRDAYIAQHAPALAARRCISEERARDILRTATASGAELSPDFDLLTADGQRVTVADLLKDRENWHGKRFADPLEPDYRHDSRVAYADLTAAHPCIYSHAHGGVVYRLALEPTPTDPDPTASDSDAATTEPGNALDSAKQTVEDAIAAAADDCGAVFEDAVLDALRLLRDGDRVAFQRLRARIKRANRDIRIGEIDRAIADSSSEEASGGTLVDEIIAMVREAAQLWHDADGNGYATFAQNGHYEHWRLDSKGFADWCSYRAFIEIGAAPGESTLKAAIVALSGIAKHEGEEHPVGLRVMAKDGRYYLDLCNEHWQVVEIDATGWRILDKPPVRFRRSPAMRPLPTPISGGDLSALWPLVNIPESVRPLVLAVLLEYWRPDTPYPLLLISAPQGTAKSTTHSRLRDLTDPNRVNLRAAPKTVEDVFVSAGANHIVSYENLSHLSDGQQDALCTLATGGGFAARTLYTNTEETVIEVQRPVILNGIGTLATRQDLVDRTVRIEPPLLTDDARREETDLKAAFDQQHAAIVGGLLDLFVKTLAKLPTVTVKTLPRMADFARLGEAMMQAEGSEAGAFLELYQANRERSVMLALESSPVATALEAYIADWSIDQSDKCSVKVWKERLEHHRPDGEAWPHSPKGFADALRRAEPGLRVLGIAVQFDPVRRMDGYHVAVKRLSTPLATAAADIAATEEGAI